MLARQVPRSEAEKAGDDRVAEEQERREKGRALLQ